MNETRLENCRGVILDPSLVFISGNKLDLRNRLFKIASRPSPSYKMLESAIGSFHGFGIKSILSWYVPVESQFSYMFLLFVFTSKKLIFSAIQYDKYIKYYIRYFQRHV